MGITVGIVSGSKPEGKPSIDDGYTRWDSFLTLAGIRMRFRKGGIQSGAQGGGESHSEGPEEFLPSELHN